MPTDRKSDSKLIEPPTEFPIEPNRPTTERMHHIQFAVSIWVGGVYGDYVHAGRKERHRPRPVALNPTITSSAGTYELPNTTKHDTDGKRKYYEHI